ncbi:hypothetical protein NDU88_003526 [Pleurodeles waltl]|uniref:Uncharacterized protein n=1 Tax=Pleurodeles waltl TaxID=8319 RepID=A0AAV7MYS2_PLEWA|nr:hypothetical protein NDU88_003526 [Pleurodeles waltl]
MHRGVQATRSLLPHRSHVSPHLGPQGPGLRIAGPATPASPTERPPQQGSLPPRVRPGAAVSAAILSLSNQPRLKNGRLKRTPTPETKKPLSGRAEQRRRRSRRKSLVKTADPGELCERAATLQEKRGHSRYGVRNEGKRAGGGR